MDIDCAWAMSRLPVALTFCVSPPDIAETTPGATELVMALAAFLAVTEKSLAPRLCFTPKPAELSAAANTARFRLDCAVCAFACPDWPIVALAAWLVAVILLVVLS